MITAIIKGFDRRGGSTFWIVYQEDIITGRLTGHKGFQSFTEAHGFFMDLVNEDK